MFWKKKKKMGASELADLILDELVRKIIGDPAKDLHLGAPTRETFEAKTRFYQLVVVLMALREEERTSSRFLQVREHLERNVFPSLTDQRTDFQKEVKSAMQDLSELITHEKERKVMSWARRWLLAIGVDETNPITLTLFETRWMDYTIMVVKTLRELNRAA